MRLAAYIYRADLVCPTCVVMGLHGEGRVTLAALDMGTEDVLDQLAAAEGIDREDEHTFDSGDFPKIVFDSELDEHVRCGGCGEEL